MTAIAYVVGTRPSFVKTARVVHALRDRLPDARHVLIHTGHADVIAPAVAEAASPSCAGSAAS